MKKLIAVLLALVLLAGLSACVFTLPPIPGGAAEPAATAEPDTTAEKEPVPTETEAPSPQTDTPATAFVPETEPASESGPVPSTEPAFDFQELTAFDNDACSMKILGHYVDSFWGFTLRAQFENKTEDQNLRFTVETAAVNDVTYDPYFSTEVAAGKKATEEITFSDDELSALLGLFTDVELTVRVYDADDWYAEDLAMETFHVYPYGEARAESFTREPQPTDTVLADNDRFSLLVTGYDPEGFWGYTVKLYLVNKTDMPLTFSADEVSVNGFMCDPFWGKTVPTGKTAFSDMDWSTSSFEELEITNVEEIEFRLRVYNADDFLADDLYDEVLTLHP